MKYYDEAMKDISRSIRELAEWDAADIDCPPEMEAAHREQYPITHSELVRVARMRALLRETVRLLNADAEEEETCIDCGGTRIEEGTCVDCVAKDAAEWAQDAERMGTPEVELVVTGVNVRVREEEAR